MPLPAANRLPLRKERDRLQKEGKTFHTRHFTVLTAPASPPQGQALKGTNPQGLALTDSAKPSVIASDKSSLRGGKADAAISLHKTLVIPAKAKIHLVPRFSILLSKKTARLAVDRNLIRRRISALLAETLPQFPVADYLVIPKRSVLDALHSDLLSDLTSLLPKLT